MRAIVLIGVVGLAWAALARPAAAEELRVSELVADCTQSMAKCNEDFVLNDLLGSLMMHACGLEDPLRAEQIVADWLARHPDEQDKDARTGIEDAKRAMRSCMN